MFSGLGTSLPAAPAPPPATIYQENMAGKSANQRMDQPLAISDTMILVVFRPSIMHLSSSIYIPQPHGRNEPR